MREGSIVAFVIIASVVVGGLLYLYGGEAFHESTIPHQAQQVREGIATQIASGSNSGSIDMRANYVITDPDQFEQLWQMVYSSNGPVLPDIDFTKYDVLAVFDGTHSTNGFNVKITDVQDTGGQRVISIEHVVPGDSCNPNTVSTSPFVIVKVPKSDLPVTHNETTTQTLCQ